TALLRMLERFENENAAAFTDDEAVAVAVPRTAGFFRLVVASGKGSRRSESSHDQRGNRSFSSACEHNIGVAALNQAHRIAYRVSGSRAGRDGAGVGTLRVVEHRDPTGCHIDDEHRHRKW